MKNNYFIFGFIATLILACNVQAEPVRNCMVDGTLKKSRDSDKVYVAFHSAKPAEDGASCKIRRNEKLQFKAPTDSGITDAEPGAKVRYHYKEDADGSTSWELKDVSST